MYLIDTLRRIVTNKPVLFTTPGHSQGKDISPEFEALTGKDIFKIDYSEIIGLDNLQNPSDVLLKSQNRASEIYGSKASYYLVNGSSSGILALMLSTVNPGEKVLIARNAHKSVINALILSGAEPVWINTEWIDEWQIPGPVNINKIEKTLNQNPDIKSIWLTNPTYEGVVTDIKPVANLCRERDIILIVDEAHGALWNFSDRLPVPAIQLGADASVQSLHKTASCLNQGAILHLGKDSKISPTKLQQCLNIVTTTSPSYILLASIESSIEFLNSAKGKSKLEELLNKIDKFKEKVSSDPEILFLRESQGYIIDPTKMFFGIKNISGNDLADILYDKFNIEVELDNYKGILALTGIGTSKKKLDILAKAVQKSKKSLKFNPTIQQNQAFLINPEVALSPREAFYKNSKKVKLKDSIGFISKDTIVKYPPGIPVLISGEIIQKEHLQFLQNYEEIVIIAE